jgi:hypothetical protein
LERERKQMSKKKIEKGPEKTGVNKGIAQGMDKEQFEGKVICKKCGKDIEYTLGSTLFLRCPRCNKRLERCLKDEDKKAKKLISLDIMSRSKRMWLAIGLALVLIGAGFNILNFFMALIPDWYGLLALVLIIPGAFFIMVTRWKSASKRYKFYAWLAGWIVLAAIAVTLVSIPYIANWCRDTLGL